MSTATIHKVVQCTAANAPLEVCVNGHGETTVFKGWEDQCRELLHKGARIMFISNFAKTFSDPEIDVLSRFSLIELSIDTADETLFAQLRRGGSMQRLLHTMTAVRQRAAHLHLPGPKFIWSCVVTDLNIGTMDRYFQLGLAMGVRSFTLCNLTKYPDAPGTIALRHPAQMEPERLSEATRSFVAAVKRAQSAGAQVTIASGLSDSISAVLSAWAGGQPIPSYAPSDTQQEIHFSESVGEGMTRDCLDPWNVAMVQQNGKVAPCCVDGPIDSLDDYDSLDTLFNAEPFQKRRYQLLSGELSRSCAQCSNRPLIRAVEFRQKVSAHLSQRI
jgi:hypothetical protein